LFKHYALSLLPNGDNLTEFRLDVKPFEFVSQGANVVGRMGQENEKDEEPYADEEKFRVIWPKLVNLLFHLASVDDHRLSIVHLAIMEVSIFSSSKKKCDWRLDSSLGIRMLDDVRGKPRH